MSAAPAQYSAVTVKWTVTGGPMKGASRLMQGPEFTLGRSPDSDFVIVNDPRVSRNHARVVTSVGGYELLALNERNPVQVNGREISRHRLSDGDVVQIGATEIRFNLISGRGDPQLALVNGGGGGAAVTSVGNGAWGGGFIGGGQTAARPVARPAGGGGFKSPVPTRFLIYGVIALVGYLLFFTDSPIKKKEQQIRTEQQIQADIEAANKLREASEASETRKTEMNITLRQAQENYVRGFRDFRKGQYERALTSFQACLALNPEHALCNRYLRLTQRKFDELVQYEMVLGRKYRDQNQFQACRASFRNVMVMVKDANSKTFQEAKANYDACAALMEGRY